MRLRNSCFVGLAIATLISLPASARQNPAPPAAPPAPSIKAGAEEVLLDIVVRDKKGKAVNDLKPDDFKILDNGSPESIVSFRLIQGKEAVSHTGAVTQLDTMHQLRLVTLCFEALDAPDQRLMARKAALDLIRGEQGANVFYSVVMVNGSLLALQPFTDNKDALAKAIESATRGGASSQFISESNSIKAELRRTLAAPPSGQGLAADATAVANSDPAAAPAGARVTNAIASSFGEQAVQVALVQTMLNMLRFDASYQGDNTRMSLEALRSLVDGLVPLPGRKTVIYFTWGLILEPQFDEMFRNLKSAANRGNVTFYALETMGVKTWNQNDGAAGQLNAANASIKSDVTAQDGRVSKDQILAADTAETAGRNNTNLILRELSEDTGGFLVGDSNDLRVPLRHINEEVSSYYEVSYNPGITNYDGSFRKVKVEADRKDLLVHARNGYFALPPNVHGMGVQTFELPLLKAISDGLSSKDVEYRAAGLLLQPHPDGTDAEVLVEVPLHTLTPKVDPAKPTQAIHFSILALIKGPTGEVVQELPRDRSLNVTPEQLKAGTFTEKFSLTIPPGKYSFETAVMDRESGKIGAQHTTFTVNPAKGVAISSITTVKSYNPNAKPKDPSEPFQFQNGTIAPTLLSSLTVTNPDATLPLFFTVYKDPSIPDKPTMEIEFLRDGQSLAKLPLPLADPDPQGRIQTVFSVPAGRFPEGTYQIHAIATQGATTADSRTDITIKKQAAAAIKQ